MLTGTERPSFRSRFRESPSNFEGHSSRANIVSGSNLEPALLRSPLAAVSVLPRILYAALAAIGSSGLAILYLFDPRESGVYPVCPFFGLTGCYCPGCGTLRAIHQLLSGNLASAFGFNPYTMLALPVIVYAFLAGSLRAFGLPAPPRLFVPSRWIWALLVAIVGFWLLRNLPFSPFEILAP